eukprot:1370309-Pyramimonas_sp.AAC.2
MRHAWKAVVGFPRVAHCAAYIQARFVFRHSRVCARARRFVRGRRQQYVSFPMIVYAVLAHPWISVATVSVESKSRGVGEGVIVTLPDSY